MHLGPSDDILRRFKDHFYFSAVKLNKATAIMYGRGVITIKNERKRHSLTTPSFFNGPCTRGTFSEVTVIRLITIYTIKYWRKYPSCTCTCRNQCRYLNSRATHKAQCLRDTHGELIKLRLLRLLGNLRDLIYRSHFKTHHYVLRPI